MDNRKAHLDLAYNALAPRVARQFVSSVLSEWSIAGDVIDRTALLVSELVSNAVLHGHAPLGVAVCETDRGRFRVEVSNAGEGGPQIRRTSATDLSGRGLQLVDGLARDWGNASANGEIVVWFELERVPAT